MGLKYWRCYSCDHAEPCEPQRDFDVGDSEACARCGANAVVEQGAPVVDVVGSSPPPCVHGEVYVCTQCPDQRWRSASL